MDQCLPLLGVSEAIGELRSGIRELVSGRKPVTIDGPPGSGKPRIASFLHVLGKQRSNAFVECFCAREIPEEICELLIDDQGSFGRFVDLAENGTLAIHNIECLSDDLQNAFAERFDELGKRLNLLVLSDEHLDDLLDTNRIQLELYFRLSHTVLSIPSLASRREDLPGLIDFIASSREHSGLPIIPSSTQLRAFKSKINEWDCDNNLDGLLRQFREHFEVERCLY